MNQSKSEREVKYSKDEILLLRNILKKSINDKIKTYGGVIPELEATTRISKLTLEIFNQLEENIKHQKNPNVIRAYKDGNFPNLLKTMKKLLIFLIETDNHYEKWVGYFYIHSMLKMNRRYEAWCDTRTKRDINFEEFVEWFLEEK